MATRYDIAVIGAGIAGSAFATVAASHGAEVLVLERQTSYRDKVRGEYLHPWGVAEARRLGVEDALLGAGGTWITHAVGYDELVPPEAAEAAPFRFADLRPDVGGAMDVGHPAACQALADAAERAGSTMVRGIGDVRVTPGAAPRVRYELDDVEHEVEVRLVVAADGRASSVRRQLGLALHETEPLTMGGGMLVEGLDRWPRDRASIGTEDDGLYLVFPRHEGLARLYLLHSVRQRGRFAGGERQRAFLDSFRLRCLPYGDDIANTRPAGPLAFYPMNDSWVDRPSTPGVVLVGDAAGWNDPIIGEGLSIALRDARMVSDVVTGGVDWSDGAFDAYVEERAERLRRLRICARLQTALRCTFTQAGRQRRRAWMDGIGSDPLLLAPVSIAAVAGPDVPPPEAFAPDNIERILALC
jgi:2-polyprenyl-6-methoxyphenol hydroxylase-like FAD-dependent oxidoreductase